MPTILIICKLLQKKKLGISHWNFDKRKIKEFAKKEWNKEIFKLTAGAANGLRQFQQFSIH